MSVVLIEGLFHLFRLVANEILGTGFRLMTRNEVPCVEISRAIECGIIDEELGGTLGIISIMISWDVLVSHFSASR